VKGGFGRLFYLHKKRGLTKPLLLLIYSHTLLIRLCGFGFNSAVPSLVISIIPASVNTNITGSFSLAIISTATATVPARSEISPVNDTHKLFSFQTDFALL
jgi:hypothetical protein